MIGVIADPAEHDVVREFFELFKTPWEFYRSGKKYDVVLCNGVGAIVDDVKLLVVYASKHIQIDREFAIQTHAERCEPCTLGYGRYRIPVYGQSISFAGAAGVELTDEHASDSLTYEKAVGRGMLCRIGYDLFGEIRFLLTSGQPIENAATPALELHIAFLRELIIRAGAALVEIPPVPDGYSCIVCLTHDVDHPSIRRHGWDRATIGFIYRAMIGSVRNLLRGNIGIKELLQNWIACSKLPLVQLKFAKDFWLDFVDRYLALEKGIPSTFFVIPFSCRPGQRPNTRAAKFRGTRYGAADIAAHIQKLLKAGCEVGLHGIDAWSDSAAARIELEEVRRLTAATKVGVRMHWLYYDEQSPRILEEGGAAYDSTAGYNQTVGYRAGTTQVYKPLGCTKLYELPMHVMDTALFFPDYMDLSPNEAADVLERMTGDVLSHGGCLTVNWHDRSTAPERLWGRTYSDLLQNLRCRKAWFATASQAVEWFQRRRAYKFQDDYDFVHPAEPSNAVERRTIPGLIVAHHNISTTLVPTPGNQSSSHAAGFEIN